MDSEEAQDQDVAEEQTPKNMDIPRIQQDTDRGFGLDDDANGAALEMSKSRNISRQGASPHSVLGDFFKIAPKIPEIDTPNSSGDGAGLEMASNSWDTSGHCAQPHSAVDDNAPLVTAHADGMDLPRGLPDIHGVGDYLETASSSKDTSGHSAQPHSAVDDNAPLVTAHADGKENNLLNFLTASDEETSHSEINDEEKPVIGLSKQLHDLTLFGRTFGQVLSHLQQFKEMKEVACDGCMYISPDGQETLYADVDGGYKVDVQFHIEKLLGKGSYGTAFLAVDNDTNRQFVVKVIRDIDIWESVQEVWAQMKLGGRSAPKLLALSHELTNKVPVHSNGPPQQYPFIFLEQVQGYTLEDILTSRGNNETLPELLTPFTTKRCIKYTWQGLNSVQDLQNQKFIHGDMTTSNIMLNTASDEITPIDFGNFKYYGLIDKYLIKDIVKILGTKLELDIFFCKLGIPRDLCDEEYKVVSNLSGMHDQKTKCDMKFGERVLQRCIDKELNLNLCVQTVLDALFDCGHLRGQANLRDRWRVPKDDEIEELKKTDVRGVLEAMSYLVKQVSVKPDNPLYDEIKHNELLAMLRRERYNKDVNLEKILILPYFDIYMKLGMEDRRIGDKQLSASSILSSDHKPYFGRLNMLKDEAGVGGGWMPSISNHQQFFCIDLAKDKQISGVIIQGCNRHRAWITKFTVLYRKDRKECDEAWTDIGREFQGNRGSDFPITRLFPVPICARHVKICPKAWHGAIGLRVELRGSI